MRYQITYFSPKGHVKKLADEFQKLLPAGTKVATIEEQPLAEADVCLVGYELQRTKSNGIPADILEFTKQLTGKTVFFFATVPFAVTDLHRNEICRSIVQILPRECDYVGTYLCASQPSDRLLGTLQDYVNENPQNTRAKQWLIRCERADGCPNEQDLLDGCAFLSKVLKLEG